MHAEMTPVEACMADLEGGSHGFAFSSGRAAIACVLELVNSGSHVILSEGLHGERYRLFEDIRRRSSGLRISYVDPTDQKALEEAFVPDETKMVWVESPASPKAGLADLAMIAEFARDQDLISVCDNSNATPCLQRPIEQGFILSLHSTPGYLYGGILEDAGLAVVAPDQEFTVDKLGFVRASLGAAPTSADLELARRALGSLEIRMERVCDTAERVAGFLADQPGVDVVFYPGSPDNRNSVLAKRQMKRPGGFLSFVIDGDFDHTRSVLAKLRLIKRGIGPSGLESRIDHPSDDHFSMVPPEIRSGLDLEDGLCRLWIGLEDAEDLIGDLKGALT
jgi:cystathionine gamma-lyase